MIDYETMTLAEKRAAVAVRLLGWVQGSRPGSAYDAPPPLLHLVPLGTYGRMRYWGSEIPEFYRRNAQKDWLGVVIDAVQGRGWEVSIAYDNEGGWDVSWYKRESVIPVVTSVGRDREDAVLTACLKALDAEENAA
jgi:hypothetical protein